MKILMLAALAIAAPAIAQDAPMPAPAPTMPADPAQTEPTPAAPMDPASPAAPMATGTMPMGGYGPAAMTVAPTPGATIRYQQAPTPDQAYPAPAPMAKYPVCKKGQYDKCVERGGK